MNTIVILNKKRKESVPNYKLFADIYNKPYKIQEKNIMFWFGPVCLNNTFSSSGYIFCITSLYDSRAVIQFFYGDNGKIIQASSGVAEKNDLYSIETQLVFSNDMSTASSAVS